MRVILLSTLVFLTSLCPQAFAADTIHGSYSVTVPGESASCAQAAQDLAAAFALAAPTASNVVGACTLDTSFTEAKQSYHSFMLTVSYDATEQVNIYSAAFNADVLWDTNPTFTSYAECLNARAKQISIFNQATGLTALAVSCAINPTSDTLSYTLSIAAVGAPKAQLYQFEDLSVDQMAWATLEDSGWKAAIDRDLTAAGANIALHSGITTFYYAAQPVNYSSGILDLFPTAELCNSQLDEAKQIVAATGAKNATLACRKSDVLVEIAVRGDFATQSLVNDFGSNSPVFHSFDECMQARSEVISKNSAVGGLCVQSTQNEAFYQVDSFRIMN